MTNYLLENFLADCLNEAQHAVHWQSE